MRIITRAVNNRIEVPATAQWPAIALTTDAQGPHSWRWQITWHTFTRRGTAQTAGNAWDAGPAINNLGGTLQVTATAGRESASLNLTILGTNPFASDVQTFLATIPNSNGFYDLINHETQCRHFTNQNVPIRSFDNGYGMCQLTSPVPTYEQVWSWKENVRAGMALYATKVTAARNFLGQSGRTFTDAQLRLEAISRWNGGAYHSWNGQEWVRRTDVLCDVQTGNIGWDMTDPRNAGQTAAQLRRRDRESYARGRTRGAPWRYFGVCYADRIVG